MAKEEFNRFIQDTLLEIIECKDIRASSALYAYANFLNRKKISYDHIPLYLKILKTNNQYAIDALFRGYVPVKYFDFIRVPNVYVLKGMFEILELYQKNNLSRQTLKSFSGFFRRVYRNAAEGFRNYQLTVGDVNSLGKYLDEQKTQSYSFNRDILDILFFFSEMDHSKNSSPEMRAVARHASRIRSDFFDQKRSLVRSMTDNILMKSPDDGPGISPERAFAD